MNGKKRERENWYLEDFRSDEMGGGESSECRFAPRVFRSGRSLQGISNIYSSGLGFSLLGHVRFCLVFGRMWVLFLRPGPRFLRSGFQFIYLFVIYCYLFLLVNDQGFRISFTPKFKMRI